ncbi:MAG TPA: C39 family peptidase [Chloroflexota bacterium]|jgi:hypothetical protein
MDWPYGSGRLRWLGASMAAGIIAGALVAQGGLARPSAPLPAAQPAAIAQALAPVRVAEAAPEPDAQAAIDPLAAPADHGAVLDEALAPLEATAPHARLASVPFRTQRDGSPYAGSNCGPAALGMVLDAYGISQETNDLRYLSHTYQGTWPRRGGTALQHLARVAEDFGLAAVGLYDGDTFHQWSLAEVREQVAQGHPVIVLAKYRLLPGHESSTVRYDHYVVLWDVTPDGFIYNDPIYPADDEGFARFMTSAQLDAAMAPTMEPRQAVAFD